MEIKLTGLRKEKEHASITDKETKEKKELDYDAYYMTINGVEIKFKPAKKYVGLVDLLIAQQK